MSGIWHIPLKSRGHSGATVQNFLWQHDTVYIMDNHRAAWWCWLRHLRPKEKFDLFHVDRHTDTLTSNLDVWLEHLPEEMRGISLNEYLSLKYSASGVPCEVVRWDNYLSLFLAQEQQNLGQLLLATHRDGDTPNVPANKCRNVETWELPGNLDFWLHRGNNWIVNIDIDYFFCEFANGSHRRFLSEDFIASLCAPLKDGLASGVVKVLTICLTPDEGGFSGGWAASEAVCAEICKHLGIPFSLP